MSNLQPYEELERRWAEFNGLDPAGMVVCSSGTAALHLAMEVFRSEGMRDWCKVIVSDFTMVAVPRAVTLAGYEPLLVDCGNDLNLDPAVVERIDGGVLAGMVGCLVAVHTYGRRCDMDRLARVCGDSAISVVEDLAEAHGIRPHQATDAACWSFYRNKIVAGEEGGVVWFRDPERAAVARELRSLGFTAAHDFRHRPRGHNYRLANCLAEKVLMSLEILPWTLRARRTAEGWYEDVCPAEWRMPRRDAPWVYDLRIPGMTRTVQGEVVRALNARGIEARMGFYPMSLQEEYQPCGFVRSGTPPRSYQAGAEVFYLPLIGEGTEVSVREVFDVIRTVLG